MSCTFSAVMVFAIVQAIKLGGWNILFGALVSLALLFDIVVLNSIEIIRWLREREFQKQISTKGDE